MVIIDKDNYIEYNNTVFRKYAPLYDLAEFFLFPLREKIVKEIQSHSRVLDIACGTGTLSLELAKMNHEVTGIDLSQDMLKKALKKTKNDNVTFICGDATKLPFGDNSFDVSIITLALHDMPEAIRLKVLKEMKRVTRKEGKIIIADYNTELKNGFLKWVEKYVPILWETKYYSSFIKMGLPYYISGLDMNIKSRQLSIAGFIQIVTL
jgi:ubiquinone/menaquinone biosynthesis C-methylase UbiE